MRTTRKIGRLARRDGERGVALLYAVFGAFIAAGLVTLMVTVSRVADRGAAIRRHGAEARYRAEGAIEAAKKQIQTSIANWQAVPASGTANVAGTPVAYTIVPTGFATTVTDPSGINTLVTGYQVTSTAEAQGHRATANRTINAEATPIFQFAVFYTSDLEVNPGPNMTLSGRVHTNGDMYLGSGATLTMNTNYVHAVGNIYRNRKDDPSASSGTVTIRKWVANPFDASEPAQYFTMSSQSQLAALGIASTSGFDANFLLGHDDDLDGAFTTGDGDLALEVGEDLLPWGAGALDYWDEPEGYAGGSGHTVLDASHGVGEAVSPLVASIKMFEEVDGGDYVWNGSSYVPAAYPGTGTHDKGYYHGEAGLSILVSSGSPPTWKAYDGAGADVTSAVAGAISLGTLYDARQAGGGPGNTPLVNVDVGALAATGYFPSNGLLYAAHYGAGTGTAAKGVKLSNAATLPAKLTVVSEDPIYLQGDFNKNAKKGAAVIGDAINLLSNSWTGSKTHNNGLPAASNTVYNAAMMSGNQDSSVGTYNGGLENLPRFHENWNNKICTIAGSLVNTWNSEHATGAWVYGGNRYTAPRRDWTYDTAFNDVANLPPYTPMAVSARDVVSW